MVRTAAADLAHAIRAADTAAAAARRDARVAVPDLTTLAGVTSAIVRLRGLSDPGALIEHAPREACCSCGFTRVMISRVHGPRWAPQSLHFTADAPRNPAFAAFVRGLSIPLSHMLVETDLVRRRIPMLVRDPARNTGAFQELVRISGSSGYAAVPIMPTGRVIGFLHADRAGTARDVDETDLEHLWVFAENFGLAFEGMVLEQRIRRQRDAVQQALQDAVGAVDAMCAEAIELARHEPVAAGMHRRPEPVKTALSAIDRVLTPREREVLELMAQGRSNGEIGRRLGIGTGTVKTHTTRILRKLHVTTRAEAAARYVHLRGGVARRSYDMPPVGGRGLYAGHGGVAA